MPEQTFSSLVLFEKKAGLKRNPNKDRKDALKHYFSRGGIIRANLDSVEKGEWPSLVYPTKMRLRALIREKNSLKENYLRKKKDWEKTLRGAEFYNITHSIKKFSSPLYWKHLAKTMSDPDYRSDAEKVKLPLHLVSDPRWRPMIRMFIENEEYRKQLIETVEHSIVYKKHKKVARYANELRDFRRGESTKKIAELQKKIDEIEADLNSYRALVEWANE